MKNCCKLHWRILVDYSSSGYWSGLINYLENPTVSCDFLNKATTSPKPTSKPHTSHCKRANPLHKYALVSPAALTQRSTIQRKQLLKQNTEIKMLIHCPKVSVFKHSAILDSKKQPPCYETSFSSNPIRFIILRLLWEHAGSPHYLIKPLIWLPQEFLVKKRFLLFWYFFIHGYQWSRKISCYYISTHNNSWPTITWRAPEKPLCCLK